MMRTIVLAGRAWWRRAVSLVEVLVGTLIIAGLLGGIVSFLNSQTRSLHAEKAEVAVIEKAARIADDILWGMPFADVLTPVPGDSRLAGEETIEGTTLSWSTEVVPVDGVTFAYNLAGYHEPHAGGEPSCPQLESAGENTTVFIAPPPASSPVLLDVKITVQWKSPVDSSFGSERQIVLFVRRADL